MNPNLKIAGIPTAPGHEDLVHAYLSQWLKKRHIPFREDKHGNLVARLGGKKGSGIAFVAHMDHPGFDIQRVKGKAVECHFLGGVPPGYFKRGVAVDAFDKDGNRKGLLEVSRVLSWDQKGKRILLRLKKGKVEAGMFGMWRLPVLKQTRTHFINRVCDDLSGCAAILATMDRLRRGRCAHPVYAVFTRREEIGLQGAYELARSRWLPKSTAIISIENSRELCHARQGNGPIIRVGDRLSIFDPVLTTRLCVLATKAGLKHQRRLMDGGTCEATAFMKFGYATSGLCLALGNYHNCGEDGKIRAENIHQEDWEGLVRLMILLGKSWNGS